MKTIRIEWQELRKGQKGIPELYNIMADLMAGEWEFYERSAWDISWRGIPATATRLERVKEATDKSSGDAEKCVNPKAWHHSYPPLKHKDKDRRHI